MFTKCITVIGWSQNSVCRRNQILGVYLDSSLTWSAHINAVPMKLSKLTSVFHYVSTFINGNMIIQHHYAYIYYINIPNKQ